MISSIPSTKLSQIFQIRKEIKKRNIRPKQKSHGWQKTQKHKKEQIYSYQKESNIESTQIIKNRWFPKNFCKDNKTQKK